MVILSKKIKAGEVRWKGIVIPKDKKELFPLPGVLFDLSDGSTSYRVKVDKQYRIRLTEWFNNHAGVKEKDEIIFSKENGTMYIHLAKNATNKSISLRELVGKETREGKIIDVQITPDGPVAILQSTKEIPLNELLNAL